MTPVSPHGASLDYQRIFDSTPAPYLVLDTELVVVAVNDAYLQATLNTRESLLGKPLFDAFPDNPGDPAADGVRNLRQSLDTVLVTGEADTMALQRYDIPADPNAPDGAFVERYWSPVNTPVFSADGTLTHIIHRVEDVTEFVNARQLGREQRRAAEAAHLRADRMEIDLYTRAREVQDANHQLREVNDRLSLVSAVLREQQQAKDRFIATLSHELRNPLAAVQVATELLAGDVGETHPAVGVLQRQVGALIRMTDDLLDAARALTGRLSLDREVLDFRQVVEDALRDGEPELRGSGRTLKADLPKEMVPVDGDRIRLAQVLGNLLTNARKYTEPGATVEVELSIVDREVLLSVRDNGIGFDPEIASSLFDVFSRAESRTGADAGGLGIGLAIVHSVVESHGGTVSAHSDGPGSGAEFRIRLPLAAGRVPVGESKAPAGIERAPLRILIIEDNVDLAKSYRRLLEQRGDKVCVANTGTDGIARASMQEFDLVLCDIGLPDMDGKQVAQRLRRLQAGPSLRLVAVSGFGQEQDGAASLAAGFDAHVAKPMRLSDLDALLASWA